MPKVLIITYYWPPSGGGGVQRWLKFVKYLPEFGWQPVVYTPENPESPAEDHSLLNDIPEQAVIVKKTIWEPYRVYKKFTGKGSDAKINTGFLTEEKSNSLLEKISVFIRGNLFIPDARKFWINPSIRFLKKYLKDHPVDVIISTGPPHSMHLIALGLKKYFPIPWIADFRDPWTHIDFYDQLMLTRSSDRKHKKLEKTVLSKAEKVIAVGKQLGEELVSLGATDLTVLRNGHDIEEHENSVMDKKFSILHAGSMNNDRNHPVLWEVLGEMKNTVEGFADDLEIKLVGKTDYRVKELIRQHNLADHVKEIEYLPHKEVVRLQCSAQVLYLPINNTPNAKGILTGKIFEYLASSRPILAIGPENGEVADILKETQAGDIAGFHHKEKVGKILKTYYNSYKSGKLNIESKNTEKFSRKNITAELVKELEKLSP